MKTLLISRRLRACLVSVALLVFPQVTIAQPGVVTRESLVPFGGVSWAAPDFEVPTPAPDLPILNLVDNAPEAILLRRLYQKGEAAGFDGVIYDNHDRGHSSLPPETFPSLPKLYFSEELKSLKMDFGLAGNIILPAIVIGNSSTAITKGKRKRSQPRLSMTSPNGPKQAYLTYVANHLYIYPEHRDHDAADLFPANWPYMVITQGSSFSDQPFMKALFMTVAAFTPETQKRLKELNLIAPTLQMILRRSQKAIYKREAYLSGAAHPTVFFKKKLVPERMVAMAAALKPTEIPPMVYLSIEDEDFAETAGLGELSEKLFDTPSAIARIWRSTEHTKRMVVSADSTVDPNDHALTFNWVVLRGDPNRVRISPIGPNGASAEISVDWHDARTISDKDKRVTNRVDIGVFAWNGYHDSAPAIISISFPGHQLREYEEKADGSGARLVSVDYDAHDRKVAYDPVLYWSAPWQDRMTYDDDAGTVKITRTSGENVYDLSGPKTFASGEEVKYRVRETDGSRYLLMDLDVSQ